MSVASEEPTAEDEEAGCLSGCGSLVLLAGGLTAAAFKIASATGNGKQASDAASGFADWLGQTLSAAIGLLTGSLTVQLLIVAVIAIAVMVAAVRLTAVSRNREYVSNRFPGERPMPSADAPDTSSESRHVARTASSEGDDSAASAALPEDALEVETSDEVKTDSHPAHRSDDIDRRPTAEYLDRFVTPLVVAELGLSVFATLLMLVGVTMFDPGGDDELSPIVAVGMVVGFCLIPAYFIAVFGVLKRLAWGRWGYLGVFVASRLVGVVVGLSTAESMWGLAYEPLYTAYACQRAALFCLFFNELKDVLDKLSGMKTSAAMAER